MTTCLHCGAPLEGKRQGAKFCSPAHRLAHFRGQPARNEVPAKPVQPIDNQPIPNGKYQWLIDLYEQAAHIRGHQAIQTKIKGLLNPIITPSK